MTETACVISGCDQGDNTSGHVGSPSPACGELHQRVI
jgi:long-chain acyl-CoA synthetase